MHPIYIYIYQWFIVACGVKIWGHWGHGSSLSLEQFLADIQLNMDLGKKELNTRFGYCAM